MQQLEPKLTLTLADGGPLIAAAGAAANANSPPVISDFTVGVPNASKGAVSGTVIATDPDGDTMTYRATTSSKGSVSITRAGVFTYTPTAAARHAAAKVDDANPDATDTVMVVVTDAKGAAATQAIPVPISPKNAVPVPRRTVKKPNAVTGVVSGSVTATDANRDPLTYATTSDPTKGTVTVTASGGFTYTPTAAARHAAAAINATAEARIDAFTVTVTDGYGGEVEVPVTVSISPANTAPAATVAVNAPDPVHGVTTGTVTASDADGDPLTYAASRPAYGTVDLGPDGGFTYTPTSVPPKADRFRITVSDGHRGSKVLSVTVTAATVRYTVSQIFSNEYAFAVLKTDGSVVTWGKAGSGGDSSDVAGRL